MCSATFRRINQFSALLARQLYFAWHSSAIVPLNVGHWLTRSGAPESLRQLSRSRTGDVRDYRPCNGRNNDRVGLGEVTAIDLVILGVWS